MNSATRARHRIVVQLLRRAHLQQAAVLHQRDAIGHRERILLIVRHEERGEAEPAQRGAELVARAAAQVRIEIRERLVEQQRPRLDHQRARERDALLLAARERLDRARRGTIEPDVRERGRGARAALRLRDAARLEPERDVLLDRHVREERVVLKHHPEAAHARCARRDVLALEPHAPGIRRLVARDHAQRRRLPRAARAHERHELAARDLERQRVDGELVPEAARELVEREPRRAGHQLFLLRLRMFASQ